MSGYDEKKVAAQRSYRIDRLCDSFGARELLCLLHPHQLNVLYRRASELMDWDDEEEDLTP